MTADVPSVPSEGETGVAPSVQGLVRALRRHAPDPGWSPAEHHAAFERAAVTRTLAPGVSQTALDANGVAAEWQVPEQLRGDEVLVHVHGGGFIMGSLATTRPMASHLAQLTGRRVLVVEYALAPLARHPVQLEQVLTCVDWVLAQGLRPDQVVLAGDSAGANLALAAAQVLRGRGLTPAGAVLMSPLLDLRLQNPSIDRNAEFDPQTPRWLLELMVSSYLGERPADDPAVTPMLAELRGLPPLLVQVAGLEALLDDSLRLAEVAKDAGVVVELQVWPGMIHVWHAFAPRVPEAVDALRAVGSWLDALQA